MCFVNSTSHVVAFLVTVYTAAFLLLCILGCSSMDWSVLQFRVIQSIRSFYHFLSREHVVFLNRFRYVPRARHTGGERHVVAFAKRRRLTAVFGRDGYSTLQQVA